MNPPNIIIVADTPFSYNDTNLIGRFLELSNLMEAKYTLYAIMPDNPLMGDNDKHPWVYPKATQKHIPDAQQYGGAWCSPTFIKKAEECLTHLKTLSPTTLILTLGTIPLWLLTGLDSADKWRGSRLKTNPLLFETPFLVMPTLSMRSLNASPDLASRISVDFSRLAKERDRNGLAYTPTPLDTQIKTTFKDANAFLSSLLSQLEEKPLKLSIDIETKNNTILCLGFALNSHSAVCVPFWHEVYLKDIKKMPKLKREQAQVANALIDTKQTIAQRLYSIEEESTLLLKITKILRHKNALLIGQNLAFEFQFFAHYWLTLPVAHFDTMIAQHLLLPGTPKALGYLHSLYGAEYLYWKDDGKFWEDNALMNYPQLWEYNCKDCANTFEVYEEQRKLLAFFNLGEQMKTQMRRLENFSWIMYRGVRIDTTYRTSVLNDLARTIYQLNQRVAALTNRPLNVASPLQLSDFFYKEQGLPRQIHQITKQPTTDDEALKALGIIDPLYKRLTTCINQIRSYNTALAAISSGANYWTGRFHSAYNTAGAETFRCSSSKDVWGQGMNMQNATSGKEIAK